MPVDRKLLEILVCPISKQPLHAVDAAQLQEINALIAKGKVHNLDGEKITARLTEALMTENGNTIYPITDDIPQMVEGKSIAWETLKT